VVLDPALSWGTDYDLVEEATSVGARVVVFSNTAHEYSLDRYDPRPLVVAKPELDVLEWIGRPVFVLLNQTGPPRPRGAEDAEVTQWQNALGARSIIRGVLALDAFARCWVQEIVLLRAIAPVVEPAKRDAYERVMAAWQARRMMQFDAAMDALAAQIAAAACDRVALPNPDFADKMRDVLRALLAAQAVLTIVLASLAPLTMVFYASTRDYDAWLLFNALMFAIASFAAQRFLRRQYRALIGRNPVHRRLLYVWLTIFAFVGIQMGWVLRPFIGQPNRPVQFFRHGAWGNAYVEIAQTLWRFLRHLV
jgi:hypothetical protein